MKIITQKCCHIDKKKHSKIFKNQFTLYVFQNSPIQMITITSESRDDEKNHSPQNTNDTYECMMDDV